MESTDARITKTLHSIGEDSIGFWKFVSKFGLFVYLITIIIIAYVIQANGAVVFWFVPAVAAFLVTYVVRVIIRRHRPNFVKPRYVPMLRKWSFPSAHSAVAFSFATTLSFVVMEIDFALGFFFSVLFLILAMFIALSRIVLGVHYFSDTVVGGLLGIAISVMLVWV